MDNWSKLLYTDFFRLFILVVIVTLFQLLYHPTRMCKGENIIRTKMRTLVRVHLHIIIKKLHQNYS